MKRKNTTQAPWTNVPRAWAALAVMGVMALVACKKDTPDEALPQSVPTGSGSAVWITDEGNFQWGNAQVSWYDPATGTAVEDLYAPANGAGLGDVCQSMVLHGGKGYVVVNNSGKVEVVDPESFVSQGSITGLASPRYLLPVGNGKAYVTDLYAGAIAVVDLATRTVTGSIPCVGWTEELALVAGEVFITNKSKDRLYVADPATDALVDSISVSLGGNSLRVDAQGKLWLACSGGGGTPPALYRIAPATRMVEAVLPFPTAQDSPWRLSINGGLDTLYWLNGDVWRMPIGSVTLPAAPFLAAEGRNLYGLGVDPANGTVYLSDASDYVQRGTVYRYRPDGVELGHFLAGIVPGSFCFQ
jgi:YVTN family beta-propeller protein